MQIIRNVVLLGIVLGCAYLALSPRRRSAAAEQPAHARRTASPRFADREARVGQARERWDGEGGSIPADRAQRR